MLKKKMLFMILFNIAFFFIFLFVTYVVKAKLFYDAHGTLISENKVIRYDPKLGFLLRPNLHLYRISPKMDLFTDNMGARIDRPGIISPKKIDVLGIGCSFTWGDHVNSENTYLSLLSKKTGLIVSNFAQPSYGTTEALLSLEKYGYLSPKIVIYGFIEEHMRRMLSPCAPCEFPVCRSSPFIDFNPRPYIHAPISDLSKIYFRYITEVMAPHQFGLIDIYWAFKRDLLRLIKKDPISLDKRFSHNYSRKEEAFEYLMNKMISLCRELKAKLIIVYIPRPNQIHPPSKEFVHVIEKVTDSKDIFFVDVTRSFQQYAEKIGKDKLEAMGGHDSHPGELAHQLIADALLPTIEGILSDSK